MERNFNNKIIVYYNNKTLEIYVIMKPNNNNEINPDDYKKVLSDSKEIDINNIDFLINDSEDYDYYITQQTTNYVQYIDLKSEKLIFKLNPIIHYDSDNLFYNMQENKRNYSKEQADDIYNNDYLNFSFKNIYKSNLINIQFIPIKDLNIRNRLIGKRWDYFYLDPFLAEDRRDKIKLGKSIIENGTYYPLVVSTLSELSSDLYVYEGNHRLLSLKLLQEAGEIPEDFKICCIVLPYNLMLFYQFKQTHPVQTNIRIRGILEVLYGNRVLMDNTFVDNIIESLKNQELSHANEYTLEYNPIYIEDIIFCLRAYPLFLRDLLYNYRNDIQPKKMFINEDMFRKWLDE